VVRASQGNDLVWEPSSVDDDKHVIIEIDVVLQVHQKRIFHHVSMLSHFSELLPQRPVSVNERPGTVISFSLDRELQRDIRLSGVSMSGFGCA
jgi:hypothetical protein